MTKERFTLPFTLVLAMGFGVFVVDLITPPGLAVWMLHVGVVLLSVWLPQRRRTYFTAAYCSALTMLGILFSPTRLVTHTVLMNRALAVGAFWATAIAGLAARRAVELEKSNAALQDEIARREKLEAQLLRTQRLESIGVLVGGIAHDFNNLLTPVLMSVKLLEEDRPLDERRHLLATLKASAERGADVVRQLLSFAGGVEGRRVPLHLHHLFKEITGIIRHTFPKTIELRIAPAKDLRTVLADATQISQVVMNLCVNARDAMPDGGILTVSADNMEVEEDLVLSNPGARVGPHVRVTVEDSGTGIAPEVLDRVFDPFFTTKEQGKGTGLGLSTALGIVKAHGGFIQVSSAVGKGTRFEAYLPAHATPEELPEQPNVVRRDGEGELILLVDDEALILDTVKATLEERGYHVLTAGDGREALAVYDRHQGEVNAVILDMMMPGMDGRATLVELRRRDPAVRVIASSGQRAGIGDGVSTKAQAFLPKPYGPVNSFVSVRMGTGFAISCCRSAAGGPRTGSRSGSTPPSSPRSASSTSSMPRGLPGTSTSTRTLCWDTASGFA